MKLGRWKDQTKDNIEKYMKEELRERLRECERIVQEMMDNECLPEIKHQFVQQAMHMEQEQNERLQRMEEDLKKRGREMNRGNEMRVTSVISELRREMDQYLRNVKVIEDAFEQIKEATGITSIEEIVTSFIKAEE